MAHWTQVDIHTSSQGIDAVSAMLTKMNLGSIAIQDAEDFKNFLNAKDVYWDYIEDDLMKLTTAPTIVTVYLSQLEQGKQQLVELGKKLDTLKEQDKEGAFGPLTFTVQTVREEDWATAWKEFYHPQEIGKHLLICPSWQSCAPKTGQVVVQMDPGMAFGTGTHESTKLCLEALNALAEKNGGRVEADRVLDIGCGSGILAVSALRLGAKQAEGVDIDEVAVKTATENATLNQVEDRASFQVGSLTDKASGQYDIIFANIVADIIISLASEIPKFLTDTGSFITSGIIEERAEEVKGALLSSGLEIINTGEEKGWVTFHAQKRKEER